MTSAVVLSDYCAVETCSPSTPCATCATVPVPRQTMAELVYPAAAFEAYNNPTDDQEMT